MTTRPPASRAGQKQGLSRRSLLLAVNMALAGLLVFEPALALLLLLGLAPSLVMLFFDVGSFKGLRLQAMALFNIAGVLPVAASLWPAADRMGHLLTLLSSVYNWLMIYGAAAAGAGVLWACPLIAAALLQVSNDRKVREMERQREKLAQGWERALPENADGRAVADSPVS